MFRVEWQRPIRSNRALGERCPAFNLRFWRQPKKGKGRVRWRWDSDLGIFEDTVSLKRFSYDRDRAKA